MSTTISPEFAVIDTVDAGRIDQKDAIRVLHMLEAEEKLDHHEIALMIGDKRLTVPADVSHLFLSAYRLLAAGRDVIVGTDGTRKDVVIEDEHAEVSTGEAATILEVSRPHIVDLVNRGILRARPKSTVPGSPRRLRRSEVLEYKRRLYASVSTRPALEQAADEIDLDEVYAADTARTR